jgi:hypothetical protein
VTSFNFLSHFASIFSNCFLSGLNKDSGGATGKEMLWTKRIQREAINKKGKKIQEK